MRQYLVIVVAAAIAATATSFAIAQAGPQATDSATDRAAVRELKKLNRAIGSSAFIGRGLRRELHEDLEELATIRREIESLRRDLGNTCDALGGSGCPLGF